MSCRVHCEYPFAPRLPYQASPPSHAIVAIILLQRAFVFRSREHVLIAFFCYTIILAFLLPVSGEVTAVTVWMNILVVAGLSLPAFADSFRRRAFLGMVRDWYPVPLALLAYRQMGWFAQPHTGAELEESWVVWDKLLLNELGLRAVIESHRAAVRDGACPESGSYQPGRLAASRVKRRKRRAVCPTAGTHSRQ